jgi:methylase of polypeptide subunit release factors
MDDYPIPNAEAARALGEALRTVGYSEEAVSRLLGDEAYSGDREDVPVGERRLPRTRLATAVRAFFLQLPVSRRDAVSALGRRGVDALAATGLAAVGDDLVPRVRILPVGDLLVASDDYPKETDDDKKPPDYVAAYTPTSRLCDSLTPRRRIGRALDVGTGSGVQAMLAAQHARHVVATDVNARALAYTELNAALNGLTNIDCRRGSLFEPASGESFDLITCNAPYVVSPESRWAYRDGGFQADELSERIVRSAADHLADGGFATLVVSWIAGDVDEPDVRPLAWTETIDCDSWILPIWGSDPLDHAATWNDELAVDPERFGDALDTWTDYLTRLGVRWVSEGAVVLHRRTGRTHTTRVDEVEEEDLEDAGDQIQRAFESRARLSELGRNTKLLEARLSVAGPMRLEHELEPRRGRTAVVAASVQLAEGTNPIVEAPPRALEIVATLDGSAPLGDVIQKRAERLRLAEPQTSRFRREVLDVSRELLELGALKFV